jgi:hypothetical protein
MQPDNRVQSELGNQAKEFGRTSDDNPGPTKQGPDFSKYDIIYNSDHLIIRCIGCMDYVWESTNLNNLVLPQLEFTFEYLIGRVIDHQKTCTYWNK